MKEELSQRERRLIRSAVVVRPNQDQTVLSRCILWIVLICTGAFLIGVYFLK